MSASRIVVELSEASLVGPAGAVLRDVDLRVEQGECVQIQGRSGQGKSVLLEVLFGQHRLTSGSRRYPLFEDEHPDAKIGIAPRFALRLVSSELQRRLSVAQASFYQARWHSIWSEPLTVAEFLSERQVLGLRPFEVLDDLPTRPDFAEMRAQIAAELEFEGLENRCVAQLSNGELRKILLAAAYLARPRLLLLDDPFGGLSVVARRKLSDLLGRYLSEGGSIVYTSSHEDDLHDLGPRRLRIEAGRLTNLPEATELAEPGVHSEPESAAEPLRTTDSARVLECKAVAVRMNGKLLLDGVSWTVHRGQHWVITGPNGSGKSTLLALLTGDHPQSYANDIEIFGTRLGVTANLWERRRQIGYVAPELVWHYPRGVSLRELVLSGFDASIGMHRLARSVEEEKCRAILAQMGLEKSAETPLVALSEGTVRLGLLMRALVHEPKLLLLDEPTQELGEFEIQRFVQRLDAIAAAGLATIVLVTHHIDERPRAITHHLQLDAGRIVELGPMRAKPKP